MRVRVLTAKQGFRAGQVVDMETADAQRWLQSGDGEQAPAETAVAGGKARGKAGQAPAETAATGTDGVEKR